MDGRGGSVGEDFFEDPDGVGIDDDRIVDVTLCQTRRGEGGVLPGDFDSQEMGLGRYGRGRS